MKPDRLNALTDGVVAIVLTIMVLEVKIPAEPTLGAVLDVLPLLAAYLLAFVNVAIYWNNHHHMMQSAKRVTGGVLWANHALLFFLTLFPLMIRWIDEAGITPWPVASFGLVLVGAASTYQILERALIRAEGDESQVKRAVGAGAKELISFALYVASVPAAFVS
ncbi:MAG: TMEM175 family protein, partial [Sphingomicrobium sp.]